MAADERCAAESVTFAGGVLARYRHVCAFVNGQREVDAVLDPFIRQGIDGGDRLHWIAEQAPEQRLELLGDFLGTA